MYEFPFGAGQQLNLNWIINEIITIHKQLDPDYELPNFDTAFPYMNLNTLNLDWILRELKAIKDLAPTEDATLLKMVANALLAETYDAATQYNVDDIVYRDNEKRLFKCISAMPAGGEAWDSSKWVEIDVGEVLTDLLVNGGTANAVTNVRYNDHKIQQEINGTYSDVITIEDTPTDVIDRLPSSKAVYNLNGAINSKLIYVTGTISSSKLYIDDANITANMCPVSCEIVPAWNVLSNYTITATAGRITFSGISFKDSSSMNVSVVLGTAKSNVTSRTFLRPTQKMGLAVGDGIEIIDTDHFEYGVAGSFSGLFILNGMLGGSITLRCKSTPTTLGAVFRFNFKTSANAYVPCYVSNSAWNYDVPMVKRAYYSNNSGDATDPNSYITLNGATGIQEGQFLTFIFAHSVSR